MATLQTKVLMSTWQNIKEGQAWSSINNLSQQNKCRNSGFVVTEKAGVCMKWILI